MQTRTVDTIVSNDEHVRLRIFDGDIPPDAYWQEMARIYKGQKEAAERKLAAKVSG